MRQILLLLLAFVIMPVHAEEVDKTPHQLIRTATDDIVSLIEEAKGYFDKNPERFYQGVESILDELIDFPNFTRSVMGPYGTREYYLSLGSEQKKNDYKNNYKRFVTTFREGLINTYAKGLLAFNGQEIIVEEPSEQDLQAIKAGESVDITQKIKGDEDTYTVVYKMRPDQSGKWKLRNVIIENINVGVLYRNQFVDAMDKHKGDFGKLVDNWVISGENVTEFKSPEQADKKDTTEDKEAKPAQK